MPYELKKTRKGFFVTKKDNPKTKEDESKRTFSKKPLSREKAVAQLRALYLSDKK